MVTRRGFIVLGGAFMIVVPDYYRMNYSRAFDAADCKWYRVDFTDVSKPGAFIHTYPDPQHERLHMYYPRNGKLIRCRPVPDKPDWLQMINGMYVMRANVGIAGLHPVAPEDEPPAETWPSVVDPKALAAQ
jgi:hypothetical protein